MGAAKAGVSVVTFSEREEEGAFNAALKDSGARGLLFSPATDISDKGDTRLSIL